MQDSTLQKEMLRIVLESAKYSRWNTEFKYKRLLVKEDYQPQKSQIIYSIHFMLRFFTLFE